MTSRDWRLPENRREAFLRFYGFHLKYKSHPGMVYSFLPAIAEAYDLDDDGKAWLAWLNGNTQNPAMSLLLLQAAPTHHQWEHAVSFWNANFKLMDFDTDRRHQKSKFGEATEKWYNGDWGVDPANNWMVAGFGGWQELWKYSNSQPYMGRLSAWSMMEYARILLGGDVVEDMGTWLLGDKAGSRSHRNGIAVVAGYGATYWDAEVADMLGIVDELEKFADDLLEDARLRFFNEPFFHDIGRLTMESALCTYKSWHKPNRRYPNVYADMAYNRLLKAEARFGKRFDVLWEARQKDLPWFLRVEDVPGDPGLSAFKQNHYLETGEVVNMWRDYPDMKSSFDTNVETGYFGIRKDPKW